MYPDIDRDTYQSYNATMDGIKRTTVNLPAELLKEATDATGKGITETLVQGLILIKRSSACEKAMGLRGRLKLKINLDVSRERTRR